MNAHVLQTSDIIDLWVGDAALGQTPVTHRLQRLFEEHHCTYRSLEPSLISSIMFIYTTTVATNKTATPASFFQRNIEGFTVGPIHDTKVMGYPTQKVPTYEMYKGNVATFIAATTSQTTLTIGLFHGLQYLEEFVPFPPPPVVFGLNEMIRLDPNPEKLDEWFTKLVTVTLGKFDASYTKLKSYYKSP